MTILLNIDISLIEMLLIAALILESNTVLLRERRSRFVHTVVR